MKILMVNKFLFTNGGSETYIFKIGEYLSRHGHEVQYFGMEDEKNIVGNSVESYSSNMNFHTGRLQKLLYPFQIIYSVGARKAIRKVLEDFKPDVIHLNNFNYQLTPSIIYEIRKRSIPILFTAHDGQLVCPNHLMRSKGKNCEACLSGHFIFCTKKRCIHDSAIKSFLGTAEAFFYKVMGTYRYLDKILCPSYFIEQKLLYNKQLVGRTVVLHNFIDLQTQDIPEKKEYVLYFGRYSEEKGIRTLLKVCSMLPEITFIFAGSGPLESIISGENIENKGFLEGEQLKTLIQEARFSIYPSEWYENCPFSVMESIQCGTPVIGADIGGIPELIEEGRTGELFESGNAGMLYCKITGLWNDVRHNQDYAQNCLRCNFDSTEEYCNKLLDIYKEIM